MRIAKNFQIFVLITTFDGLTDSNTTDPTDKPIMEITLPTEITPKRPVLPDNWGEDRSGTIILNH